MESLRVVHQLKQGGSKSPQAQASPVFEGAAFVLDSCQRKLWVDFGGPAVPAALPEGYEVYTGADAYAFLLSVASGLESLVVGETDIFGQIKEAWKQQSGEHGVKKELGTWMQRLFEDTKEIRSRFLQNLGGSSYGSLLRKLLKDHQSLQADPSLLIGAGQLARSVAPYLLDHELLISNRTPERAADLAFELQEQNPSARIHALTSFEEELSLLPHAAQVIICVPADPALDARRVQALADSRAHVVHLGLRQGEPSEWTKLPGLHALDELFELEKSVTAVRSVQVERARAACREKATLRALGRGSTSIAHGWEDLAAFSYSFG